MLELILCFATIFSVYVAAVGINDIRELWRVDRTKAMLAGVAALGMALMSTVVTLVLVRILVLE